MAGEEVEMDNLDENNVPPDDVEAESSSGGKKLTELDDDELNSILNKSIPIMTGQGEDDEDEDDIDVEIRRANGLRDRFAVFKRSMGSLRKGRSC